MKNLLQIGAGVNIMPLALQLHRHPELWNQHTKRTIESTSPHREADDIWCRYSTTPDQEGPHESVWYPASNLLPALDDIIYGVMGLVRADALGGILITRIPAGKRVHPHIDQGWHAQYYDKIAVSIAAHPQQHFCYKDGKYSSAPGDIFWFNNRHSHWVENNSPVDRITLIICVRMKTPLAG